MSRSGRPGKTRWRGRFYVEEIDEAVERPTPPLPEWVLTVDRHVGICALGLVGLFWLDAAPVTLPWTTNLLALVALVWLSVVELRGALRRDAPPGWVARGLAALWRGFYRVTGGGLEERRLWTRRRRVFPVTLTLDPTVTPPTLSWRVDRRRVALEVVERSEEPLRPLYAPEEPPPNGEMTFTERGPTIELTRPHSAFDRVTLELREASGQRLRFRLHAQPWLDRAALEPLSVLDRPGVLFDVAVQRTFLRAMVGMAQESGAHLPPALRVLAGEG